MTKIIEKNKKDDMHSHIDKAYDIINEHLPENYTDEVIKRAADESVTKGIIRNLRYRITKYPSTRLPLLNIMVQIALEHKEQKEQLSKLVNQ